MGLVASSMPARTGRPPGQAPCLECGVRRGRAGSGFCPTCYKSLWLRTRRFRRLLGTGLTFTALRDAVERLEARDPVAAETRAVLSRLFTALQWGTLLVVRNGQLAQAMAARHQRLGHYGVPRRRSG